MASSSKPKRKYDVFLSFRGVDLRNNFVSHLYKVLDQNGIYTFIDREELRKGDQISPVLMEAIEESCIAIIVFSEDYASSRWCLEELAKIMECKEQKDLTVLPLFYKVDPREVRGGRESYGRALAKHESKFRKDSEKVKRWKKALFDAGNLSGWHLNDGDEPELIQGIVKEISTHLDRTPLHVAKHPVGIDSQVVKLKSMLNLKSDDGVLMVGIWGQGGIGKTALGDCAVKAIVLELPKLKEMYIGPNDFTKMRGLRLLIMRNVHNSFHGPICLPNALRWFQWVGCAPGIPEFSSGPKKLVGLDMRKCNNIPVQPNQYKDFQNLKYINFSHCKSLVRMPDLSCIPNLEELDLRNCKNLVEAHESIAYHDKLQVLNLRECSKLSVFPNVLKSKNLQALDLCDCKKFERFPDIPNKLEALKELRLRGTAIKELPASIENLVSLETMYLNFCKNLVSLPSSIYKLQNLKSLLVEHCTNFIGFPKYDDSADSSMKTILSNLRRLDLYGCNLSEIEFFENLSFFPFLRELSLGKNNITSIPTSINKRKRMSRLNVRKRHQLQEMPELPPFLNYLLADGCESVQETGDLTLVHEFVHRGLTKANISPLNQDLHYTVCLSEKEMPKWILPIEEDSVSFMASEDLYDKFLGFALYVALGNDEQRNGPPFELVPRVDGERRNDYVPYWKPFELNSDYTWLEYFMPFELWGVVNFGQIDGRYTQFSLMVSSRHLKKWGFRIICKQLEDNLKVEIQDNQLINPVFLYEVGHDSTGSEVKSSLMHQMSKDFTIALNLGGVIEFGNITKYTGRHVEYLHRCKSMISGDDQVLELVGLGLTFGVIEVYIEGAALGDGNGSSTSGDNSDRDSESEQDPGTLSLSDDDFILDGGNEDFFLARQIRREADDDAAAAAATIIDIVPVNILENEEEGENDGDIDLEERDENLSPPNSDGDEEKYSLK
ncbi:disease resistance protein Roq1-like [Syzygium oleosum]|uniref:disease resistance protein Roq1-like n=1 Tax=Syzygium oleosum TaxID=219896 RepID=UPI0024B9DA3C|nr:disease resistance protein Roq1-like [Syzygium oleosum]